MRWHFFYVLAAACFAFPMLSEADVSDEGYLDQTATSLFGNPPEGIIAPKQVEVSLAAASFFMTQKAINSFPFGLMQAQYVSQQRIKSTTLDAYRIDSDGRPDPEVDFRIFVDFDQSGNVVRLSQTRSSTYEYIYQNEVLTSIVIDNIPTFSWNFEDGIFSEVSNPNSPTTFVGSNGRVRKIIWNYDGRTAHFGDDDFVPMPTSANTLVCVGPNSSNSCYETENGYPTLFSRYKTLNGGSVRSSRKNRLGWADGILENVVGVGEKRTDLILTGAGIITDDGALQKIILLRQLGSWIDVSYSNNFSPIDGIFEVLASREDIPRFTRSKYSDRSHLVLLNPVFTNYYP